MKGRPRGRRESDRGDNLRRLQSSLPSAPFTEPPIAAPKAGWSRQTLCSKRATHGGVGFHSRVVIRNSGVCLDRLTNVLRSHRVSAKR